MHRHLLAAALIFVLLLPALLFADDFSAFRIPRHQVVTARTSLFGSYLGSQGTGGSNASHSTSGSSDLSGLWNGAGYWLSDSDPLRLEAELTATLYGRGNKSLSNSSYPSGGITSTRDSRRQSDLLEQYHVFLGTRVYPWALPLGFSGSAYLDGYNGQRWRSEYERNVTSWNRSRSFDDAEIWGYHYAASGNAAVGIGRVRDATRVFDVAALEQRLRDLGVLTRPLLPATRQRLISLFYIASDFSRVHERSSRYFWREVETALKEDGGLRVEGLDAYSLYRIAESQFRRAQLISPGSNVVGYSDTDTDFFRGSIRTPTPYATNGPSRQTGWFVGPTVNASHSHTVRLDHFRWSYEYATSAPDSTWPSQHSDSSNHYNAAGETVSLGLSGEYHRPFGLNWQLDLNSSLSHPYDDMRNIKRESFTWNSGVTLTRFILDRWLASATLYHSRASDVRRNSAGVWHSNDSWRFSPTVQVYYYIEDHLACGLTVQQDQYHSRYVDDIAPGGTSDYRSGNFNRNYTVLVGLTYNLAGFLKAPGIAAPTSINSD